jgi:hypothetical protein
MSGRGLMIPSVIHVSIVSAHLAPFHGRNDTQFPLQRVEYFPGERCGNVADDESKNDESNT